MTDHPHTREAIERWQQGKINIFDAMAELEDQRDQWQECAERLAKALRKEWKVRALICYGDAHEALAEFDRLRGIQDA